MRKVTEMQILSIHTKYYKVKSNKQIVKLEMIEINRQMDRGKGN
jgi:hypothetical protein